MIVHLSHARMGCFSSRQRAPEPPPPINTEIISDNDKVLQVFDDLRRDILSFCRASCPPPDVRVSPESLSSLLADHPHYKLLTTVNSQIQERLFSPFHPSLTTSESKARHVALEQRFRTGKTNKRRTFRHPNSEC